MATRTECCACLTSLPCQPMMESNQAEVDETGSLFSNCD
ncbi:hypothetical protein CEXT_260191, partial [Caerostris extrusa]